MISPRPIVVVDASVLLEAVSNVDELGDRARSMLVRRRLAAPESLLVETFNAIRGRVLGHKLGVAAGARAVARLRRLRLEQVPTTLLLERMWELRANLSGYDAAYIAAAEHLNVPFVTSDRRLAAAPDIRCEVRTPY